jgi:outer membrane biosynthesis protein TonB
MKLVLGTTLMFLLVAAPMCAAQEPDKDKPQEEPKKQEQPKKGEQPNKGRQDQEKPADKPKQEPDRQPQPQDHAKPAQQNDRTQQQQQDDRNRNQGTRPAAQNDRTQQNDRAQQQDQRNRNDQSRPAQQQDRPQDQQRAQQTEQHNDRANANERGGGGRRVPDEQFRASFGREHHFHVRRSDDRRFNYGGYYFQYSDAWPSGWDYDNDDVYIDYIDGNYYLINPRHSGVRLLVVIAD